MVGFVLGVARKIAKRVDGVRDHVDGHAGKGRIERCWGGGLTVLTQDGLNTLDGPEKGVKLGRYEQHPTE